MATVLKTLVLLATMAALLAAGEDFRWDEVQGRDLSGRDLVILRSELVPAVLVRCRLEAVTLFNGGDLLPIHAAFATEVTAFHWHGQTFDIPRGAVHLAGSEGCPNQAFIYEDRVLALQYHLETTPAAAEALIHHCGDEITEGPYIQTPETILSSPDRFTAINAHMARLLDHLSA